MSALWLTLVIAVVAPADGRVPPGVYCAYDAVSLVSPPGEVRTIVRVEGPAAAPTVRFQVTWPHSFRILRGGGRADWIDGALQFDFEDGWGNPARGRLSPRGELSFDFRGPAPTTAAEDMRTFFYSGAAVTRAACRPGDGDATGA